MSTLSYDKKNLINSLKAKRSETEKEFEKDKSSAKAELVKAIQKEIKAHEEDLVRVEAGKEPKLYYPSVSGRAYRKPDLRAFDLAIARLETCVDEVIKLSDRSDDQILRLIA